MKLNKSDKSEKQTDTIERSPSPSPSEKVARSIGMKISSSSSSLLHKLKIKTTGSISHAFSTSPTSDQLSFESGSNTSLNSTDWRSKFLRKRSFSNPLSSQEHKDEHQFDNQRRSVDLRSRSPVHSHKSVDIPLAVPSTLSRGELNDQDDDDDDYSSSSGILDINPPTSRNTGLSDNDDSNDDYDYDYDDNNSDYDDDYDDHGEAIEDYSDNESGNSDEMKFSPEMDPRRLNRRRKSKMEEQEAASVIGGASIISDSMHNNEHGDPEEGEYENDNEVPKTNEKVFSFSLPLGVPNLNKFTLLPKIITNVQPEDKAKRSEIKLKIKRGSSITTLEEEFMFKDVKSLRNERAFALKKALTPSFKTLNNSLKPDYLSIYDELEGDVLLLGGYRGSILRDVKTHRRAWIPVFKAGLNLRKIDLFIGPSDEDEKNVTKTLYPDGILDTIGPVDICHKLIKKFQSNSKVNFHNFGYDWRISLDITSNQLYEKLVEINQKNGGKGCIVIAHSMGGLVAHGVLQRDPTLFRGLVYVGSPHPSPNVLGPTRFGDKVLFDTKMLSPENNFMMRSSFIFLPRNGEIFKDKHTNEKYNLDFFNPDTWVEYNLSPLVCMERKIQSEREKLSSHDLSAKEYNGTASSSPNPSISPPDGSKVTPVPVPAPPSSSTNINTNSLLYGSPFTAFNTPSKIPGYSEFQVSFDEAYDYLTRTLKRTAEYLDQFPYDKSKADLYPPLVQVYGNRVPSVRFSMVDGVKGIKDGDWYDFSYGPGDGVVHQRWLMPDTVGFNVVAKFVSTNGHMDLLNDLENMGKALLAIVNNPRKKNIGSKGKSKN